MASWAQQTHGSTGRLLLTQRHGDWWIVNDSDLERTLLCGSPAWVARIAGEDSYEAFSWRPDLTIARWIMNNYDL
jgi:hypothetical protein